MTFQSSKRGAASGLEIFSMKAPLSIGANRPERLRSSETTPVISAPRASLARKSVMAMGSGSMLPLLTSISTSARAGSVAIALIPAARAPAIRSVERKFFMEFSLIGAFRVDVRQNISLGSKFTMTSAQVSYLSAGSV